MLDPIFALRRRVRVAAGGDASRRLLDHGGGDRAPLLDLIDKHRDAAAYDRRADAGVDPGAGATPSPRRQPGRSGPVSKSRQPSSFTRPRRAPYVGRDPARHRSAIGPVVDREFRAICRSCCCESPRSKHSISPARCCTAHEYWRMKQLAVDLVILNERASSYVQDLQIALETLVRASQSRPSSGVERRPGRGLCLACRSDRPRQMRARCSSRRPVL